MDGLFSQLVVLGASAMLVTALIVLWRRGVPAYITAYRWQSWLLGGLTACVGYFSQDPPLYFVAVALILLKGVAIPFLLRAVERRFGAQREVRPYVNTETSLLAAGLLVLFAYALARPWMAVTALPTRAGLPLAMALLFVSLFIIVSRKKAITQVVGFLMLESLLASAFGPGLGADDAGDAASTRRFRIFQNAFALTMLMAVTANNVAMMWVAIEATTIASAITIPLVRTKASVEASWKYLLICSVGIALAFTGTVLAYFDFVSTAGRLPGALHWGVLHDAAPALHPELMQLAFAFILIGYGTKAGLAPMHTWMPD